MDKDDARTGSPSKGAGEKVTRRKPTVTRAPKAIIQKLLSRTLTKLRAILTELESRIKDPELRAALEQASGASALRVDLGHCTYVLARISSKEKAAMSPRQREIVDLFLTGLPRRKIASQLNISPRTVDTHIERLFRKFGVGTRIELAQRIALLS